MNARELLDRGHVMVLEAVDDLTESQWDLPGACGTWSVKDIVAHLTAYELAIADVLKTFQGAEPAAYLKEALSNMDAFNARSVAERQYRTAQQVLDEYNDAQIQSTSLVSMIPAEKIAQPGTLSWLRASISLADFLQEMYEHTCQHSEQIIRFRQQHEDTIQKGSTGK